MKHMRKLKNALLIFTAAVILFLSFQVPASAETDFNSIAESAILIEASTGRVLYEKNADNALPPASITKIMTLLLGFEAIERGDAHWDDQIIVSEKAWAMKTEGSVMFLEPGMKVPLETIITGISVVSANDGCIALAEHLSGTEEAFVQQMNKRAQELGLKQTQFKNSNGLPAEGHRMSARDISTVARYLIEHYPKILEIESMTQFTFNGVPQNNRNPLLGNYPGADGLKTGSTDEAGYCLVGTAKQNGMRLISVVLKTKDVEERLTASRELLDYGYRNFEVYEAVKKGEIVDEVSVKNGKELTVPVKINESVTAVVPRDRKADIEITAALKNESVSAPVKADTTVGNAEIRLDGEVLATAEVSTAKDVEKAGFFELLFRGIANFFKSLFKVSKG